jgi:formylglycine-generating enzyme required for sulfatase activity
VSDIFLSYAREDLPRVKPVVDALTARGWSVWWDRTIKPGQSFPRVIQGALDEAQCVVVLWSRDSVESDWVQNEARRGHRRRILIPAMLDEVLVPLEFEGLHTADLVGWTGALPHAGFDDLARAVEGILPLPAAQPAKTSAAAVPESIVIQPAAARLVAGQTRVNPKDGLTYVWIPADKFMMGCSPGDSECYPNESPRNEVSITKGFWMGQTPVTQEAYQRVMGSNPSTFKGPRLPVETVSWDKAQAYCKAIGMRLATEAEWEYAARAASMAPRYGSLDAIAWHSGNSGEKTQEVGQKQPNRFGLYDTLGNVWEWVADWYEEQYYGQSPATDPPGPASGQYRVLRGGSWYDVPRNVRSSIRFWNEPTLRLHLIGFRCAGELR